MSRPAEHGILIGVAGAASLFVASPAEAQASQRDTPSVTADAYPVAEAGYAAVRAGDSKRGAQLLAQALESGGLSPEQARDVRLTLTDTLVRLGQPGPAADLLAPMVAGGGYAVQSRLAYALDAAGRRAEAASAYRAARASAPTPEGARAMALGEVYALAATDRHAEALAAIAALVTTPDLPAGPLIDLAGLASRYGDDGLAQRFYARADALQPLEGETALNAGYSARRAHDEAAALRYFRAGLAGAVVRTAAAEQRNYEVRREIADLSRRWGAYASVFYDDSNSRVGRLPGAGRGNLQAGAEVYYRPFGYNSGRPVEVFARAFETLETRNGGATGSDSLQGWIGVRAKPLAQVNLVLEASRLVKLGHDANADTQVRASYSATEGMDLRPDRRRQAMFQVFADAAHLLDADEEFGLAEARLGRSFRGGPTTRSILAPFVGAYAGYDSGAVTPEALGAGPGLWVRQWFRPGRYAAPRSYVDLTAQYRFRVAGDRRAEGFFASLSISY